MRYYKVTLLDFSRLHIKEIWKEGKLTKYSYYWFTADNQVNIGWDNAPHHKRVDSFPHHKHRYNEIEASGERDLTGVLEYLNRVFDT